MTNKFSMISEHIVEYRLKPRDHAVYCCLVKHSDKNGVCFPSRRLIAEECCIDKKTVDAAIRSLEKVGLVKKKKRHRQNGSQAIYIRSSCFGSVIFLSGWCKKRYCRTIPIELNLLSIDYSREKKQAAIFSVAVTAVKTALFAEQKENE